MIFKRPTIVLYYHPIAQTYLAVATFLPIARWRHVMASFRMSRQVEGQLKHTPGVIAYSLAVDPRRRHFWTYSLWASRDAMLAFSHAEPHAIAAGRYDEWADEGSAFVEWHTDSKDLDWNEAFERLKQPTFTRKPA